jgi:hypothetical protein
VPVRQCSHQRRHDETADERRRGEKEDREHVRYVALRSIRRAADVCQS